MVRLYLQLDEAGRAVLAVAEIAHLAEFRVAIIMRVVGANPMATLTVESDREISARGEIAGDWVAVRRDFARVDDVESVVRGVRRVLHEEKSPLPAGARCHLVLHRAIVREDRLVAAQPRPRLLREGRAREQRRDRRRNRKACNSFQSLHGRSPPTIAIIRPTISPRFESLGVKTALTPSSSRAVRSASGIIPPITSATSAAPRLFSNSIVSRAIDMCAPARLEIASTSTSSSSAVATICSGVCLNPARTTSIPACMQACASSLIALI